MTLTQIDCTYTQIDCTYAQMDCTYTQVNCTYTQLNCTYTQIGCTYHRPTVCVCAVYTQIDCTGTRPTDTQIDYTQITLHANRLHMSPPRAHAKSQNTTRVNAVLGRVGREGMRGGAGREPV